MSQIDRTLIETVINASPRATLVADRDGGIVCLNGAARALLRIEGNPASLYELFECPETLNSCIRRAFRMSGALPALAQPTGQREPLRLQIQLLQQAQTRGASHLLITLQTRKTANQGMLLLKQRLNVETAQRRRLLEQNTRLRQTVEESIPRLQILAHTDELTGLFNRRYFDTRLHKEWRRAMRQGGEISLVYLDVDHFKEYNDGLGHPEGDQCLRRIGKTLLAAINREFDSVCRIGGEEFAVLMPMTGAAGAVSVAQRLHGAIRQLALPHPRPGWPWVTVSLGVGSCTPLPDTEPDQFVRQVDAALYRAKHTGRDRLATIPAMPPVTDALNETAGWTPNDGQTRAP